MLKATNFFCTESQQLLIQSVYDFEKKATLEDDKRN